MTDKNLLTLYVMTYNRPDYLEQCLESIAKQNYKKFNLIVSDNGSDKNYSHVLKKYSFLNIKYIKHKKSNQGSILNFKFCFTNNIDTKYIMVFHDDDIMHPSLISYCINYLENNEDIVWIGSALKRFTKINTNFFTNNKTINVNKYNLEQLICSLMLLKLDHGLSTNIYRYEAIKKINFNNLINKFEKHFDRPLMFNCLSDGKCAVIKNKLVGYRMHGDQDSKESFLNENYLFELMLAYKKPLKKMIHILSYYFFYSSFQLITSYYSINKKFRPNLSIFISRAIKLKIINFLFIFFYCTGCAYFIFNFGLFNFTKKVFYKIFNNKVN